MKKWKYNISGKFEKDGKEHHFITQLYQIGIYCIFDGETSMQTSLTPNGAQKMCKSFKNNFENNEIQNLVFGREITVIEENGFYKELND